MASYLATTFHTMYGSFGIPHHWNLHITIQRIRTEDETKVEER